MSHTSKRGKQGQETSLLVLALTLLSTPSQVVLISFICCVVRVVSFLISNTAGVTNRDETKQAIQRNDGWSTHCGYSRVTPPHTQPEAIKKWCKSVSIWCGRKQVLVGQELWAELEGRKRMGSDETQRIFWEVHKRVACMEWSEHWEYSRSGSWGKLGQQHQYGR